MKKQIANLEFQAVARTETIGGTWVKIIPTRNNGSDAAEMGTLFVRDDRNKIKIGALFAVEISLVV